jgi:hypothetical protein
VAAWADGMVIPTIAYPAKITIPDQRALIHFTNGVERLVIETRFTGEGTNFAWVVPFPSQPVIEEATTGLFPTLQYLFRPEIVHHVPRYYIGILAVLGFFLLIRITRSPVRVIVYLFLLAIIAAVFLPALGAAKRSASMASASSEQAVSILDRKVVGIFETATIASREPKALENWLFENGFLLPTNAAPVIADYVKNGWVFVAAKVRRDQPGQETSTPHPLSFTFKTDRPVYPMRLTGLNNPSLTIGLYVFSHARASAPHFKVESCTRPAIPHSLLHQWAGTPATAPKLTATYLTATLSPADMRKDVWLDQSPVFFEKQNRLFSRHGALTIALNWGSGFFAVGLIVVYFLAFACGMPGPKPVRRIGMVTLISIALVGLVYLSLPKTEVKLVKGRFNNQIKEHLLAIHIAFEDYGWRTTAEARVGLQKLFSNPTNAFEYGLKNWDNNLVGGQIREEDSPGNYLLRETNNQLQLIGIFPNGEEMVWDTLDLPLRH